MHFTGNSAIKAGIGAGVLALMIGGGAFAASALSATPGASTDATSAAQSDTPVPAVLGEFEDVWRGEVRVGDLRRADADAWPDFVDGEVRVERAALDFLGVAEGTEVALLPLD